VVSVHSSVMPSLSAVNRQSSIENRVSVALLTGGGDRPYFFGLATTLMSQGVAMDLIGSDDLDGPEFHGKPGVNFLNLRGDQRPDASTVRKVFRVMRYYARLIRYAATANPRIFHILWNNKLEVLDRTLLMLYYRFLGKKIVLTAHNVNKAKRDGTDSSLNRLTLRIQYRLTHHIFVHTEKMKSELIEDFGVPATRITVIPFGINNSVPNTDLNQSEARRRLGIDVNKKTLLFFGRIATSKGLEYLTAAFQDILARGHDCQLVIAGWPDKCAKYWATIQNTIRGDVESGRILVKAEFIPDEETEVYFKAADVLVLPYRDIFQSGVLFLGYSFGLPVLVADVGSLKDDILEGETGFVFRPEDPVDLAVTIEKYFASDLFADLNNRRQEIRDFAMERHSWDVVGQTTMGVYADLLPTPAREVSTDQDSTVV
jgi:D-inositol-3-phosphate glycosyltransferase